MVTLLPLTKLLLESRRVMVMVDSAIPSATTDVGEADKVEVVGLGGPLGGPMVMGRNGDQIGSTSSVTLLVNLVGFVPSGFIT